MDVVMLPLVWPHSDITWALQQMRKHERGGVVMNDASDNYTLFYAGNLLRARAKHAVKMQQVEGGHPVVLPSDDHVQTFKLDLIRPNRTWQAYEQMLVNVKSSYALTGQSADAVMIVTQHEGQTATLMTGGYECNGTPTHYFPEPRVWLGEDCPQFPECVGPGGTTPTIRAATGY